MVKKFNLQHYFTLLKNSISTTRKKSNFHNTQLHLRDHQWLKCGGDLPDPFWQSGELRCLREKGEPSPPRLDLRISVNDSRPRKQQGEAIVQLVPRFVEVVSTFNFSNFERDNVKKLGDASPAINFEKRELIMANRCGITHKSNRTITHKRLLLSLQPFLLVTFWGERLDHRLLLEKQERVCHTCSKKGVLSKDSPCWGLGTIP